MQKVRNLVEQSGRVPLALVHTYGCQQNVSDGDKMRGMLAQMGYAFTDEVRKADFILYNTCAVRENAESRVFGNIGALKHEKEVNPNLIIGLCGCMTQQESVVQKIKQSYPQVDIVFGTHALHRLPEFLYTALQDKKVFDRCDDETDIAEGLPVLRTGKWKAWLPIMYGCNNFCTYCIVPYVRGRERSREPEDILQEARSLIQDGYKEITLLGQNVNSYGKTLAQPIRFSQLLQKINAIEGDFRIRFMTSHPKDATHELIDTIAACDKVCKHIHLPVQSGCNRILQAMNRHYTVESYLELAEYARKKIPGVSFTSDIIVGFPGESYEEFQQTLELIKIMRYDALFTFIYSSRPGTKAAMMDDPVPYEEKSRWLQELLDLQRKIGENNYQTYVGKTLQVLADGPSRSGPDYISGRTDTNIIVNFKGSRAQIGQFLPVRITEAFNWALGGEIAK
ncbi:MAG TPA: tRNA (N6-isopentenyl adenosine(37)-C2)-methylthiotransferase MiaB [Firmicutes bacterium]|nr:tRNA (N6-isopentenyl adenosine(37)-C2)-methylthiotransferase MiaB [Bacillota bacterium]